MGFRSCPMGQLSGCAAVADVADFFGAVEFHEAHRAQWRLNQDLWPVLLQGGLGDARLHDVNRGQQHVENAGQRLQGCLVRSAPMARATLTGTGLTSPPSTRMRPLLRTGVTMPGTAMLARTASVSSPAVAATDSPVMRSAATAAKGSNTARRTAAQRQTDPGPPGRSQACRRGLLGLWLVHWLLPLPGPCSAGPCRPPTRRRRRRIP